MKKLKKIRKKQNYRKRPLQKGKIERGVIFIVVIIICLIFGGYIFVGGNLPTELPQPNNNLVQVIIPTFGPAKNTLQLDTFQGATITPYPTMQASQPSLCTNGQINDEPEILVGYSPAQGQTVGATGQIKVWVNDEGAPIIAPNEQLDPNTGKITSPGNQTATAPDSYLWEPALYIAPQTAESGGTPHFPTYIKGQYNNNPSQRIRCDSASLSQIPTVSGMDPPPAGSVLAQQCTSEDIWDVSSLGLGSGTYQAEFVIHDGDFDRGIGCVTITIQ